MTRLFGSNQAFRCLSKVAAVVAATTLLIGRADALSCAYEPDSLEESYALADGIFVAQALGCADGAIPQGGRCPDDRYHIETIEVLKEPKPWQDFSGTYQGANGTTLCGQAFTLGDSYLLFFGKSKSIISSAGGALKGPYAQTREVQGRLAILRDYRDGKIADLSGPWIFTDIGLSCELKQTVAGHQIAFRYPYIEPSGEYAYGIAYDNDGNPTLVNPTPASQALGPGTTRELDGPDYVPHALNFTVQWLYYVKTERDTATITVGERTWNLETLTVRLLREGRELSSQAIDLASGEKAQQIFDAMFTPSRVTVSKRGQAAPAAGVARVPTPLENAEDVVVETGTTQFARGAKMFQECVSGTRRAVQPGVR